MQSIGEVDIAVRPLEKCFDLCVDHQEYFKAAAEHIRTTVRAPAATDISGVWLSSDDESVFAEVGEAIQASATSLNLPLRREETVSTQPTLEGTVS